MKKLIVGASLLAMVAGGAWAAMKPEDAIVARKAVLRVVGLNFGPLGAMAQGKAPYDLTVVKANAARIQSVITMPIGDYFPAGSGESTLEVTTKAKPEIWTQRKDFDDKLKKLAPAIDELVKVAAGGNEAAIKAQIGEVGKVCKGCHDDFREK